MSQTEPEHPAVHEPRHADPCEDDEAEPRDSERGAEPAEPDPERRSDRDGREGQPAILRGRDEPEDAARNRTEDRKRGEDDDGVGEIEEDRDVTIISLTATSFA